MQVLNSIPVELNVSALLGQAHLEAESEDGAAFLALADQVLPEARPKAMYRACFIEARGNDTVTIEGITFQSHALRSNLDKVERVFVYIATCGNELDRMHVEGDEFLTPFWLDLIKARLLGLSLAFLGEHLNRKFALTKTSSMSPGSGDAMVWPIQQQRELFSLLGDVDAHIGVELTDSFLMMPNKTVSGMRFATEVDFKSCQLCHRKDCPSRSAAFDRQLWESVEHDNRSDH